MVLKRKITRIFAGLSAIVMAIGVSSCKSKDTPQPSTLKFTEESYTLERFMSMDVLATGAENIAYSSSDESVCTITADGKLIGIKEGTTTLTATAGKSSVEASVLVKRNTSYPLLTLVSEELKIPVGTEYPLEPALVYKGESLPVSFSYESDAALKVKNGNVKATAIGDYELKVSCNYAGETFEKNVTVQAVSNDYYYLETNEIVIYASDLFNEGLPTSQSLQVFTNVSGTSKFTSSDESIVKVDADGTVRAVSHGTAKITVSLENYKEEISVKVLKQPETLSSSVTWEYEEEKVEYTAINDGDVVEAFIDGVRTDNVTYNAQTEKYEVVTHGLGVAVGEQMHELKIETQNRVYTQPFIMASMIIDNLEEFKLIQTKYYKGTRAGKDGSTNQDKYRDGYFILNADINKNGEYFDFTMAPIAFTEDGHGCGLMAEKATKANWYGVLEGNGHVIYNVMSGYGGMFGGLPATSEIRNLAIVGGKANTQGALYTHSGEPDFDSFEDALNTNKSGTYAANCGFFARGLDGATIENVYIEMAEMPAFGRYGVLSFAMKNNTTLKNIVINIKACADGTAGDRHAIAGVNWGSTCSNVFVYGAVRPYIYTNDTSDKPSISRSALDGVKSAENLEGIADDIISARIPYLTITNGKLSFGNYTEQ